LKPFVAIVFDLITNSIDAFGGTSDSTMNKKKKLYGTALTNHSSKGGKKCTIFPKVNKAPRHEHMAQAVSRGPPTAESRGQSQSSRYEIMENRAALEPVFLQALCFCPVGIIPYSFINHRRYDLRN
jgi:hypothetical protein